MNKIEDIKNMAKEIGFDVVSDLDISTIELKQEVRDMCAANKCNQYNKNWACPPGCGSLEQGGKKLSKYSKGIIVQTIGDVEDSFDIESMIEIEEKHKKHFTQLLNSISEINKKMIPFGTGCCTICSQCTYPDKPCRFPEKSIASMEAYGMIVSNICKLNNVTYYYGPEKLAYTACFALE